jgi:hypothetical protein
MSNRPLKGKVFDDGITRYYDPTKHSWLTREEVDRSNNAAQVETVIYVVGIAVLIVVCLVGFISVSLS